MRADPSARPRLPRPETASASAYSTARLLLAELPHASASAEAAGALQALLDMPAAQGTTLPRARALAAAANLVERVGSYATADRYCEEALAIARAAGDGYLLAELLH
jgi:hypothetical protein